MQNCPSFSFILIIFFKNFFLKETAHQFCRNWPTAKFIHCIATNTKNFCWAIYINKKHIPRTLSIISAKNHQKYTKWSLFFFAEVNSKFKKILNSTSPLFKTVKCVTPSAEVKECNAGNMLRFPLMLSRRSFKRQKTTVGHKNEHLFLLFLLVKEKNWPNVLSFIDFLVLFTFVSTGSKAGRILNNYDSILGQRSLLLHSF